MMEENGECIFCQIIAGDFPSRKIFETKDVLAFLDARPTNLGHTLVIPKKHVQSVMQIDDLVLGDIIVIIKRITKALKRIGECEGVNILQNNGKAAGQVIPHAHFHIIPRVSGDFEITLPTVEVSPGKQDELKERLKQLLGSE